MTDSYNKMYEKLVRNQKDYIGMVAYSIYKRDKRDVVRKGQDEKAFVTQKVKTSELERYRKEASELLNLYSEQIIDGEFKRIRSDLSSTIDKISSDTLNVKKGILNRLNSWFFKSGFSGAVGNLFTVLIIALFFFIFSDSIELAKSNLIETLESTASGMK